jgi:hypothetical protein
MGGDLDLLHAGIITVMTTVFAGFIACGGPADRVSLGRSLAHDTDPSSTPQINVRPLRVVARYLRRPGGRNVAEVERWRIRLRVETGVLLRRTTFPLWSILRRIKFL